MAHVIVYRQGADWWVIVRRNTAVLYRGCFLDRESALDEAFYQADVHEVEVEYI